jgi:hypothetical protein
MPASAKWRKTTAVSSSDPLAIRDQVRLRGLADTQASGAEGTPRECQHAALAVRAGDERAAEAELRVAECGEQRSGPTQTEPDAEAAAGRQRGKRLVIVGRRGRGGHSRVSSSS